MPPTAALLPVAVVIPTYQAGDHLEACLASVGACEPAVTCVLVIDNASLDGSIERAQRRYPGVEFLRNSENRGFGIACNRGIELALARGAEFVLLLNQDARLEPKTLVSMVSLAEEQPRAGGIGCKTLAPAASPGGRPRILYNGAWRRWLPLWQRIPGIGREETPGSDTPREVDFAWGHALLLRSSALREVGLFDPGFFMYMEDLDLCDRLQRAGWQIWCDSQVVCWHAIEDAARGQRSDAWRWQMKLESIRHYYRQRHAWPLADLLWLMTVLREGVSLLADRHWRACGHVVLGLWRCAWGVPAVPALRPG